MRVLSRSKRPKALKAFLYGKGARQAIGHSVGELCRQSARSKKEFGALARRAGKPDRFYIPTRYPNGLPGGIPAEEYDRADTTFALASARQVLNLVKKQLNV
jgi:HEPN domain-containing protein